MEPMNISNIGMGHRNQSIQPHETESKDNTELQRTDHTAAGPCHENTSEALAAVLEAAHLDWKKRQVSH